MQNIYAEINFKGNRYLFYSLVRVLDTMEKCGDLDSFAEVEISAILKTVMSRFRLQ
jgi:hypothetical protein